MTASQRVAQEVERLLGHSADPGLLRVDRQLELAHHRFHRCPCLLCRSSTEDHRYSSLRYYGPFRHPAWPAPDPRGSAVEALAPPRWASRVDSLFLCTHTITNTPVAPDTARVARFAPGLRPSP